jgi:L-2-hydroxyglutarate oxidase
MKYDVAIVGGGIVGLASALQLLRQRPGARVCVLEKEDEVAKHQTGHNSGVIHSGIYYKPGSLKARNCFRGYQLLIDFCTEEGVPFELCGKVIVATKPSELPTLDTIYERGVANGLEGLLRLSPEQVREREPHVQGIAGIWVPQTGIINYKKVAQRYAERIEALGGEVLLGTAVKDIRPLPQGIEVIAEGRTFEARLAVNCAGLYSDRVARMSMPDLPLRIIPFRGEYYEIKHERQHLVKNLVYPVPDPNFPFLGVHFTRMIEGGVEAGPNAVLAYRREGYTKKDVHLAELWDALSWPGFQKVALRYWETGLGELHRSYSKKAFAKALQQLVPEITENDLLPGGAGVRAQACDRTGGLLDDFSILEAERVINVCNAPSPAATSSLAIGETVANMALAKLGK